jgi:hypothetical protein
MQTLVDAIVIVIVTVVSFLVFDYKMNKRNKK